MKQKKIKSGYAKDVAPSLLTDEEKNGLTVPVGKALGGQEGRLSPAQKISMGIYQKAKRKIVTLGEAQANMQARMNGEMLPIKYGLDELPPEVEEAMRMPSVGKKSKAKQYDPIGESSDDLVEHEPGDTKLAEEEKRLVGYSQPGVTLFEDRDAPAKTYVTKSQNDEYLSKRMKVQLELEAGTYTITAINIINSKYGMMIILPSNDQGATFIPKPGTEVSIVTGERSRKCYFPGTYFSIPELNAEALVFVSAEAE